MCILPASAGIMRETVTANQMPDMAFLQLTRALGPYFPAPSVHEAGFNDKVAPGGR
jgi:hypothetical protein